MIPGLREAGKEFLQAVVFRDRFLWRLPADREAVALTFDDGPDPAFTAPILDLLAREGIKATFFVIGRNVERHPELARRLVSEGHRIGAHGYDHREITSLAPSDLEADLKRCREAIRGVTGVDTDLFRPPRGKVSFGAIRRVCGLGYQLVHWTKSYSDYQCDGTDPLVARMRRDPPRTRDIVLLHDHNQHTIDALARMAPEWRQRMVAFQPV